MVEYIEIWLLILLVFYVSRLMMNASACLLMFYCFLRVRLLDLRDYAIENMLNDGSNPYLLIYFVIY